MFIIIIQVPVWAFGEGEGKRVKEALTIKPQKLNGRRDHIDPYKRKLMASKY